MLNKDYYILLSMIQTIDKIFKYSKTYQSAEELYNNDRDFDAVMMNFIVLGENVAKLSQTLKEQQKHIDWNKIHGLRNVIAHHYFGINVDIVWQIKTDSLPELHKQLKALTNSEN